MAAWGTLPGHRRRTKDHASGRGEARDGRAESRRFQRPGSPPGGAAPQALGLRPVLAWGGAGGRWAVIGDRARPDGHSP